MTRKTKDSARGQDCQIRIPGVCNFDPATTVLAHKNGGGGGMKYPDTISSYACSQCHDAYDRRLSTSYTRDQLELMFYDGMVRTQIIMLENNLIKIN